MQLVKWGLTEFMPEIFRVDDGRRQWITRVDVLDKSRKYVTIVKDRDV